MHSLRHSNTNADLVSSAVNALLHALQSGSYCRSSISIASVYIHLHVGHFRVNMTSNFLTIQLCYNMRLKAQHNSVFCDKSLLTSNCVAFQKGHGGVM